MTALRAGQRLYSTNSSAQFIIVRPGDVELTCAGAPLAAEAPTEPVTDPNNSEQLQLGKRYEDPESGLLVMCTKPGSGPLNADGRDLAIMKSKALPSSD